MKEVTILNKYKIPNSEPEYCYVKPEKKKRAHAYLAFDKIFVVYSFFLTFAYTIMLFLFAVKLKLLGIGVFAVFWGVLTYVALPRFHRLLSMIYLPDYFIARTKTGDGILGDPVNLAIRGTEEDIHGAMRRAGWTEADPITLRSSAGIVISTLKHKPYPAAPVSNLYLFDRKQQFAYQKDVNGSAAQRHHVRFWRVPEGWKLPGGHSVDWLASGTFDRGVGFTHSTLQITHKIDADVDKERDYIIDSLRYYDNKIDVDVIEEFSSPYHDQNGGGDQLFTDGHLPILNLNGAMNRVRSESLNIHQRDTLNIPKNNQTLNRELPPKSFVTVGFFMVIRLISLIIASIVMLFGGLKEEAMVVSFVAIIALIQVIMYMLTLKKKRKWCRLILLIFVSLSCTAELATLIFSGVNLSNITDCGVSVIMMLILSTPDIRQWVYEIPKRGN